MDTSKEYIKMCEKAGEIQRKWQFIEGDFYKVFSNGYICVISKRKEVAEKDFFKLNHISHNFIWLPRQDQLQEMINPDYLTGFIYDLYEYSREYLYMDNGNDLRFTSMEQLWLAFVMKECYQKVWNGKDWFGGNL